MEDLDKECFEKIVNLSVNDIGSTEENVKNNVVVTLLECLGHKGQLDFERQTHSGKIDIFLKNLPRKCSVIIEVKNLDIDLWNSIPQLERYIRETGAALGVLTNGDEILIFDPSWRGRVFNRQLIFRIQRKNLIKNLDILTEILSREALRTESAINVLESRQGEIEIAEKEIEKMQEEYDNRTSVIQGEIYKKTKEMNELEEERDLKFNTIYERLGITPIEPLEEPSSKYQLPLGGRSLAVPKRTQKDIVRQFIMGDGTRKRSVTTDDIFEHVKELPEFRGYKSKIDVRSNAVWKACQLTKLEPEHFSHPDRNTFSYDPQNFERSFLGST